VLHKQSFDHVSEVRRCVLEPGGTFYVEAMQPTPEEAQNAELMETLAQLTREIQDLRAEIKAKA